MCTPDFTHAHVSIALLQRYRVMICAVEVFVVGYWWGEWL
jgi:hypothetical protein